MYNLQIEDAAGTTHIFRKSEVLDDLLVWVSENGIKEPFYIRDTEYSLTYDLNGSVNN